jgi:hypothetical protein
VLHDLFSLNIFRALHASMRVSPPLRTIKIEFVTGANTNIDLIYNHQQKSIQIHQKWIDFEKSHENVSCDAFSMREDRNTERDLFFCDHIVEDLFELTLAAVSGALSLPQMRSWILRRTARQLMQRMPRMVRVSRTTIPNQLKVTWTGNESSSISKTYAKNIRYVIILHKMSTCQSKRWTFLNVDGKCIPGYLFSLTLKY